MSRPEPAAVLIERIRPMPADERRRALRDLEDRDTALYDLVLDGLWGETVTVAAATGSPGLKVGDVVGARYRLAEVLGEGASGSVYRALDVAHVGGHEFATRELAIKVSRMDTGHDALNRDMLQKEARLLGRLRHPRLPVVEALFEEGGRWFVVMDYIAGDSLKERRQAREQPFEHETVAAWMQDTLRVLDYLHTLHTRPQPGRITETPVFHRDVKPANLILDPHDNLYVVDLGIAQSGILELTQMVPSMVGRGSPGYAAPEVERGEDTLVQSDLYSVGMSAFTLLGPDDARLFPPRRRLDELAATGTDPFEAALSALEVPNGVREWVRRATALAPQDRYASAAQMIDAVSERTATMAPRPATADLEVGPASSMPSGLRRAWPWAAGIGTAAAAVVLAITMRMGTEAAPSPPSDVLEAARSAVVEPDTSFSAAADPPPVLEAAPSLPPPPSPSTSVPQPAATTLAPRPAATAPAPRPDATESVPVQAAPTGAVRAVVLADDGSPLGGARVTLVGTGLSASADPTGDVVLRGLPPGPGQLRVEAEGYYARTFRIDVEAGGTVTRTLQFEILDLEVEAF